MYKIYFKHFVLPPGRAKKLLRVMKLTTLLLFIAFMQVSAATLAQKVTLSEKNAPLITVLTQIKKQTGYDFAITGSIVERAKPVTINVKNEELQDVLNKIFETQPLNYKIEDKSVIISAKQQVVFEQTKAILQQPVTVSGRVIDGTKQALSGATVREKGTNNIVATNQKGDFTITVPDEKAVISFSFVGYETQEFAARDITKGFVITLKAASNNLKEVVINKGYYSEKQMYSVGNVAVVSGEELQKQPVTDPILALEGRVAGLSVTQSSGVPGSNSVVRIRGQNSLTAGTRAKPVTANDPLFIIDGLPFDSKTLTSSFIGGGILGAPDGGDSGKGQGLSPFNSLNSADIESIEVLKDADATAIYGSRGANGVILITTKQGKPGKIKADVNFYSGASKVAHQMQLLNTQQYLQLQREALKNDNALQYLSPEFKGDFPDLLLWDTTRYTDWQKVLIDKPSPFTNINTSISGGSAYNQLITSLGYNYQGTTMPGDYSDRRVSFHTGMTNSSADKRFKSQIAINYSNDNSNLPRDNIAQYVYLPPDAPAIYNPDGSLNWEIYHGRATWHNPFSYTKPSSNSVTELLEGSMNLSYQIFHGLDISSNFGYSTTQMTQKILLPGTFFAPPADNNPNVRSSAFSTASNHSWSIEPQASYTKKLGKGDLSILVGTTFQSSASNSQAQSAQGFSSDALIGNIMAASYQIFNGVSDSKYHYNAVYGRIGYIFDQKYMLNLTARRDGSSRFGQNKQFGNFGATGLGWIFSKEKWFEPVNFLSFGKLRGSYGVTGNDQIGDYGFLSTYQPTGSSYLNTAGLSPTLLANPDFRWEQVRKLEAGLELGFFKDRINLSASWYRNRTGNQLVAYPLPNITGFTSVTDNLPALLQNTGWEFTLSSTNIKSDNFSWHTNANLSLNRSKLISFPGIENTTYKNSYFVGYPLGERYLYHFTGVNPETGYYQFETKDGTGVPNFKNDRHMVKPLTPVWFAGLGNSVTYKQFALDFFIQVVKQSGIQNLPNNNLSIAGTNSSIALLNRWQQPGDITNIQRVTYGIDNTATTAFSNFLNSDGIITDASYARLKNLSLSYTLPGKWKTAAHLSSARVYLQGQNLFTLTKYKGLDPETQSNYLPPSKTITFGIQVGL